MSTVEATIRDQSTNALIPVEGVGVTSSASNPTAGQALRQLIGLADGSGSAYYVTVDASGNLHVASGGARARTNRSSTITTGGTAQAVFTAGQATNGFYFQNLSTSAMYLRQDGTDATATTGAYVAPNGFFQTAANDGAPTTSVSVLCATTGAAYYCETF